MNMRWRGHSNTSMKHGAQTRRRLGYLWKAALLLGAVLSCAAQSLPEALTWRQVVVGKNGMVAAQNPREALAAIRILQQGGNAIDAAVAAFYMTAVTEPVDAGLGGDGFILAYIAQQKRVILINATGYVPKLATREFYQQLGGITLEGPYSTNVPGAVGGFDLALKKYGTMPYSVLLADAIDAAENGHVISSWGADRYRFSYDKLGRYPSSVAAFFPLGRPWEAGEVLQQRDLAKTLRSISQDGADTFYRGALARKIAQYHEKVKGLIRQEDLSEFHPEEAEPIRIDYKGHTVYQAAPNSNGIVMLMALNILKGFELSPLGQNTPEYLHVLIEALKLAFADRHQYVTDPRFYKEMPVSELLSEEYGARRRALIRMDQAIRGVAPPGDPRRKAAVLQGRAISYQDPTQPSTARLSGKRAGEDTSSFAIADRFGNLVSVTHSLNGDFGSGMVVEGAGFALNNRATLFSLDSGDINVIAPRKRTRNTTAPALALKNGKPFLAWNTSGGDTIPQTMLQAFLNVVEFRMSIQQACEAPTALTESFRASNYPQLPGDGVILPKVLADQVAKSLTAKGHLVKETAAQEPYRMTLAGAGAVKMILIDAATETMQGGVSPAKDDYALGW